jgi:hypothetical protein
MVWNTHKEVFVANVVDVALANYGVFMWRHTHNVKVTSAWYRKANGILSPSNNDMN